MAGPVRATLAPILADIAMLLTGARFDAELVALRVLHHGEVGIAEDHGGTQLLQPRHLGGHGTGSPQVEMHPVLRRLGLGNLVNQIFGPPQPAASTNALSVVESSSTSEPKTAAQNLASASASAASNDTDLITLGMFVS
jgi:hypothetical protein